MGLHDRRTNCPNHQLIDSLDGFSERGSSVLLDEITERNGDDNIDGSSDRQNEREKPLPLPFERDDVGSRECLNGNHDCRDAA